METFKMSIPNFMGICENSEMSSYTYFAFMTMMFTPAGPSKYHGDKSVYEHISELNIQAILIPKQTFPYETKYITWMIMMHDLGKIFTPSDKWPHHYGHDSRSAAFDLVRDIVKAENLPDEYADIAIFAIKNHMKVGLHWHQMKNKTKRKIKAEADALGIWEEFKLLCALDSGKHISEFCIDEV